MAFEGIHSVRIELWGKVQTQHRPRARVIKRGGKPVPQVYEVKEDTAYKAWIASEYKRQSGFSFGDKPVEVQIHTYRKLPGSRPKKVDREQDVFKPDADNIAKAVLDALVKADAFDDDAQVVRLVTEKHPRTRLEDDLIIVYIREQ